MKIAIYGPMCSGKTTVASIIQDHDKRYSIYSFGQKIKDIANELFQMEGKDRSLLINIADKMRDIDEDVWVKYIIRQTDKCDHCIIDDLRFQNELEYLGGWKVICLIVPDKERIKRIKHLYPNNYDDHIKNMKHISENDKLRLPSDTIYLHTDVPKDVLISNVISSLNLE